MDEPPPSIRVSHHHRYHHSPAPPPPPPPPPPPLASRSASSRHSPPPPPLASRSASSRHSPPYPSHAPASPMAIKPNAANDASVPPALPPPTHIYEDLTPQAQQKEWIYFNKDYVDQHWTDFGKPATVRPGSSLLSGKRSVSGSDGDDPTHLEMDPCRRGSSLSTVTAAHRTSDPMDERIAPNEQDEASSRRSSYRLQSERQLEQRSLSTSSQAYDRNLLSKIGGPNTPNRLSVSQPSPGGPDNAAVSPGTESRFDHSRHLSTSSERRHPSVDSSSFRWSISAVSPGLGRMDPENSRPPALRHSSFPFDDNASHRSSYDQSMFLHEDFPMEEGGQMKELNLNDRSPSASDEFQPAAKAGMKRRASSPHRDSAREDRSSISSAPGSDLYTRRSLQQYPNRNSSISTSRYAPSHGSISSASSYNPRNGSLASSYTLSVSSSSTSYASGRISPGIMSPAIDPELGGMPFLPNKQVHPSPGPLQPLASHPRTLSEPSVHNPLQVPVDSLPTSRHNSTPNVQGIFMCECCPKKPKKFGTEEELRAHHMEKQYSCAYCPNRFKNKNEAERHQNSLHLRRHSWSCAALATIESAFHPSQTNNGLTDTCGFCGEEFPNPPDWERRRDHVCQAHKFGECNQAKKFYRADHFRQHLKHSHAGTSGKWTNMLETTCMRDEPPPQPINVGNLGPPQNPVQNSGGMQMMGLPNTAGPPGMGKPEVINEVPHES